MNFKILIEIDGEWLPFTWGELNQAIISGVDLTHNKKRFWTGLLDKNGKEIYESDIVKRTGYLPQEIWFEDGGYLIGIKDNSDHHFYQAIAKQSEIIGNIHENPELLK